MDDIKPIRNEKDYNAALAEVAKLWGSPIGTAKGDRLDVLATLFDAWEAHEKPGALRVSAWKTSYTTPWGMILTSLSVCSAKVLSCKLPRHKSAPKLLRK